MAKKINLTISSRCLLSNGRPALLNALKERLTIDNPKYKDAKKYGRWVGKKIKPRLFFYEERDEGFFFPRGFAGHAIELCRRINGSEPEIVDRRRRLECIGFDFKGKLRPYQHRAVNDVLRKHFGVLVAGTGSGKTVMALAVIAARKQPTLILVHTKELFYQWKERVHEFLAVEAGMVGDGVFSLQPVTIGIVNSVRKHLLSLPASFGQIIVDECHRVPASLFTEVVTAFDCRYTLGLSATAYRREDGMTPLIYYYMGDKLHQVAAGELEAVGAVLRPEFIQRQTPFEYRFRGEYQALLNALAADEGRNRQIVDDIVVETRLTDGIVLVVSDRVAHCELLAEMLSRHGVDAQVLTGRLSADKRAAIVEMVRRQQCRVLISTLQLVGEGFDAAGLATLFLTTPIKFSGRLRQVVGRVLRPAEGKKAKVIDYCDSKIGVLRASAAQRQQLYQEMSMIG